jgi:hypothetical protein
MADARGSKLELFELYLATAEKVSDRRAQANAWMLSVNSAIVALCGYLRTSWPSAPLRKRCGCQPSRPRVRLCAWPGLALLSSYRKLNRAKFTVLTEIEADLPVALFTREREAYRRDRRRSLSDIERLIPGCFALLYAVMLVAAVVTKGS